MKRLVSVPKWRSALPRLSAEPRKPGCGCNLITIWPRRLNSKAKFAFAATTGQKLRHERNRKRSDSRLRNSIVDSNRSEVRDVDAMRGGIDDQRIPAEMCPPISEDAILVAAILLHHRH